MLQRHVQMYLRGSDFVHQSVKNTSTLQMTPCLSLDGDLQTTKADRHVNRSALTFVTAKLAVLQRNLQALATFEDRTKAGSQTGTSLKSVIG